MIKNRFLLLLFVNFLVFGCQKQNEIVVANTYEEPEDPSPSKNENWEAVPNGLQASFASTNIRFVKSIIPSIELKNMWIGDAWRGERISSQLVLWSTDSITNVKAEISEFKTEDGRTLPSTIAQIRFAKYVITDEFSGGCGYRKPEDFASSLAADALDNINSYAVKSRETRPIWISIDVPQDAKSGTYKSTITLNISG